MEVATQPQTHAAAAARLVGESRDLLNAGSVESPDPASHQPRQRVVEFFTTLTSAAAAEWDLLLSHYRTTASDAEREPLALQQRALADVFERVVSAIYFGSGAHDESSTRAGSTQRGRVEDGEPRAATPAQRRRLLREFAPVFDALAGVGLPAVSHRLIETLAAFIPIDPAGIFRRIHRVIAASVAGGLQFESLAAKQIVAIVERYLADHRGLLREDPSCPAALVEILETFIDWPDARRLVYRLDEVDR